VAWATLYATACKKPPARSEVIYVKVSSGHSLEPRKIKLKKVACFSTRNNVHPKTTFYTHSTTF
jgi:hypothetical protein